MSEATNDSISIDDLFAALGTSAAPSKGKSGSKKSKGSKGAKSASAPKASSTAATTAPARTSSSTPARSARVDRVDAASDADVMNVMAALGIMPSKEVRTSAVNKDERVKRNTQREEQIREQQIRSQQWRRELEEQQKRRQMQAEAQIISDDAEEEPQTALEASRSHLERAAQADSQQHPVRGFAQDQTQIAEPSFLQKREAAETVPYSAMAEEPVQTAASDEAGKAATASAAAVVAEGAPARAPESSLPQDQVDRTADETLAQQAAQQIEQPIAPAVRTDMPSEEAMLAAPEPDKQVTIPIEDQHHDASSAPTSVIQPMSESQIASLSAAVPQDEVIEDIALPSQQPALSEPQPSQIQAGQPTGVIKPLDVSDGPEAIPASSPMASPIPESAPAHSETIAEHSSVIQPLSEAPMVSASPQLERSLVSSEPRPSAQPKKVAIQPKEKGINKGNIVGVLLIIIALVCAALTVMLLTGTIDATTFSNMASNFGNGEQQEEAVSSSSSADSAQEGGTETHAVYQYVVRGTDGSTHRATETATFGVDGLLQQSGIVIDVPDEAQAQGLLEQLRSDFGDSVVDSGTRDGEVYLTIDIDRDDLNVDSYTELLSSNMAEFRVVETGANDPS